MSSSIFDEDKEEKSEEKETQELEKPEIEEKPIPEAPEKKKKPILLVIITVFVIIIGVLVSLLSGTKNPEKRESLLEKQKKEPKAKLVLPEPQKTEEVKPTPKIENPPIIEKPAIEKPEPPANVAPVPKMVGTEELKKEAAKEEAELKTKSEEVVVNKKQSQIVGKTTVVPNVYPEGALLRHILDPIRPKIDELVWVTNDGKNPTILELIRYIKSKNGTVIVVTSNQNKKDFLGCLDAGADRFVTNAQIDDKINILCINSVQILDFSNKELYWITTEPNMIENIIAWYKTKLQKIQTER